MIKKISAILLALVLCLSIVVVPTSAVEIESGNNIAYEVKLDKEYYNAGDIVTVSLYLYGNDEKEYTDGAIVLGCNSDVIDTSENVGSDIMSEAVIGDTVSAFFKAPADGATWTWQTNATILNNIKTNNTAEENELFDQYLKFPVARLGSADISYEYSGSNTKHGFLGSDLNAAYDAGEAFYTFQLKLKDDIEDGTKINIGVPTGPMAKNYTYINYLKSPGTGTTKTKTAAADSVVIWSTAAQIGEEPAEFTPLAVSYWKDQIRFDKYSNGSYSGTFDYRILATIDNFDEVIGTDYDKVTDVGFIFNKGAAINADTAKAQVEGGAKTYSQVSNVYVSTAYQGKNYVISCLVNNIPDAEKGTTLSAMAYVEYVVDGVTYYAYSAVQTSDFSGLYNTYYSQAFGA